MNTIQLTVTSPPILHVVQYVHDNWLRCGFNCVDVDEIAPRMINAEQLASMEERSSTEKVEAGKEK